MEERTAAAAPRKRLKFKTHFQNVVLDVLYYLGYQHVPEVRLLYSPSIGDQRTHARFSLVLARQTPAEQQKVLLQLASTSHRPLF